MPSRVQRRSTAPSRRKLIRWSPATPGSERACSSWTAPGERLTDEQWRAKLDAGDAPPRPVWADVLQPSAG